MFRHFAAAVRHATTAYRCCYAITLRLAAALIAMITLACRYAADDISRLVCSPPRHFVAVLQRVDAAIYYACRCRHTMP